MALLKHAVGPYRKDVWSIMMRTVIFCDKRDDVIAALRTRLAIFALIICVGFQLLVTYHAQNNRALETWLNQQIIDFKRWLISYDQLIYFCINSMLSRDSFPAPQGRVYVIVVDLTLCISCLPTLSDDSLRFSIHWCWFREFAIKADKFR